MDRDIREDEQGLTQDEQLRRAAEVEQRIGGPGGTWEHMRPGLGALDPNEPVQDADEHAPAREGGVAGANDLTWRAGKEQSNAGAEDL